MSILRLETSNPEYNGLHSNSDYLSITVHSSYLQRRHDISVYNIRCSTENLPIVVLLHGVYGNHWAWLQAGGADTAYNNLKQELDGIDFLLVMPSDGGFHDGSAYLPLKHDKNYEQWIMQDVIDAVVQSVPAASKQSRLYLAGLSMGGYGALRLGCKFADRISGISAHSSITQLTELAEFTDTPLSEYECEDEFETSILHWANTHKTLLPPMRFDCGSSDVLYNGNVKFSESLKNADIQHLFETFEGGHEWEYWHKHLADTLIFFANIERAAQNK